MKADEKRKTARISLSAASAHATPSGPLIELVTKVRPCGTSSSPPPIYFSHPDFDIVGISRCEANVVHYAGILGAARRPYDRPRQCRQGWEFLSLGIQGPNRIAKF